jgi:translocation and assembly module TamB
MQASAEGLELRMASRGDGLRFLSVLGGPALEWRRGSADLQLLVRGSRLAPVANGFLRFREGELSLAGQLLRDLDAVVLFDFTELEVQQLSARVGAAGQISGSGHLGLVSSVPQSPRQLKLSLKTVPITAPRLQTQVDGDVLVGGSLRRPQLGGELQLSRGSININPSGLATPAAPTRPVSLRKLAEADWDFREPLLVMGQQLESAASQDLRRYLPKLSSPCPTCSTSTPPACSPCGGRWIPTSASAAWCACSRASWGCSSPPSGSIRMPPTWRCSPPAWG